jgi:hypothetical protein
LSDYVARYAKSFFKNIGVRKTRLLLETSLAVPLLMQMHSDGLFEGSWNGQRRAAMNWHCCIEAFLERIKGISINPRLKGQPSAADCILDDLDQILCTVLFA